jgi:Interferon-induced transmembrane protein/GYF domain 2
MKWHYSKNGTQLGPIEQHEMIAKIAAGEIAASDMCWREGMADWQPVSKVAELTSTAAVLPSAFGSAIAPVAGQPQNSPYASPTVNQSLAHGAVIPNYLWQSIVVTLLCCWPFGIPAIIAAAKVDGLSARGDVPGAMAASASAKKWMIISAIAWVVVVVIYVIIAVAAGIMSKS